MRRPSPIFSSPANDDDTMIVIGFFVCLLKAEVIKVLQFHKIVGEGLQRAIKSSLDKSLY